MKPLKFKKMHGAGNDFVMIDGTQLTSDLLTAKEIEAWCDRRLGIGADGLIILLKADGAEADFRMMYYNADGHEAEMCGNGARCSVAFARLLGWIDAECRFATHEGVLTGKLIAHTPTRSEVEVSLPAWKDLVLERSIVDSPWKEQHSCNTGVPHVVIPVEDLEEVAVEELGRKIRRAKEFEPSGTNVNWVAATGETTDEGRPLYQIRTYERGVEAETLACGTGASAAAVVLCHLERAESPVALRTRSGDLLRITVDREEKKLYLRGPAVMSFEGEGFQND